MIRRPSDNFDRAILLFALSTLFTGATFAQQTDATAARAELEQGKAAMKKSEYAAAGEFFRKAIELDPDNKDAHDSFFRSTHQAAMAEIKGEKTKEESKAGREAATQKLIAQYLEWAKQYPKKAIFPLFLSGYHMDRDYEKVEQYARQAIALDPKCSEAYQRLSLLAEVGGDNVRKIEYLRQAAEANPDDPGYQFYYSSSLKDTNPSLWEKTSLRLVERFPSHERGAQALYWLGFETERLSDKLAVLEKLKATYPPEKFSWSASGMPDLFNAYRRTNPDKAMALAGEMVKLKPQDKTWQAYLDYHKSVTQARSLLDLGKFAEAAALLGKVTPPRYLEVSDYYLLKAEATDHAGESQKAYDELSQRTAMAPTDALRGALEKYGAKLKKTPAQVEGDLWISVDAQAKPTKDFTLARYGDEKNVSLSDYRGKAVLINFWYPFCGPCRGENPHLQKLLTKFSQDKFVILAINVYPGEDRFVLPYLKGNKFGFTPLRGSEEFAEKEFGARGFPTNILIDQQGRVVAKPGVLRSQDSLRTFEMQVQLLLSRGAQKPMDAR
jgi:thiol-disulfide isomerase/thioredoxin